MKFPLDTATAKPRILLHAIIPGPPKAWERVAWRGNRAYNPNSAEKNSFLWQLKAAVPRLQPDHQSRIGIRLDLWIGLQTSAKGKRFDVWKQDWDNFSKFYCDALQMNPAGDYGLYANDAQIDEAYVLMHRGALDPKVEILAWEIVR